MWFLCWPKRILPFSNLVVWWWPTNVNLFISSLRVRKVAEPESDLRGVNCTVWVVSECFCRAVKVLLRLSMVHLLGLSLNEIHSTFAPEMWEYLESLLSHCCIKCGTTQKLENLGQVWFGTMDRRALIVNVKLQMVDSGCFLKTFPFTLPRSWNVY